MTKAESEPLLGETDGHARGIQMGAASNRHRHVGTLQLCILIFFCVSGGPYGLEDTVKAAHGVFYAILAILVVPWVWSLPMGLLTAELASALPENGGYVLWVDRAFGPLWAFQGGFLSWTSAIFDNTLYPVLAVTYLGCLVDIPEHWVIPLRVSLVFFAGWVNYRGLQVIGWVSVLMAVGTLLPFVVLVVMGAPEVEMDVLTATAEPGQPARPVHWGILLSTVLWANTGWDSVSCVAGEVLSPQKTYPRAVLVAVVLVMFVNVLPVMVAACINQDWSSWGTGGCFWGDLGRMVGGKWLHAALAVAAILSNFSLLNVLGATYSWNLYTLCVPSLLDVPAMTTLHPQRLTPWPCILVNCLVVSVCCAWSFDALIQIDSVLNGLSLILECLALLWLRLKEPGMPRPYRIPLELPGLCALLLPHLLLALWNWITIDVAQQCIVCTIIVGGVVLFCLARWRKGEEVVWFGHGRDLTVHDLEKEMLAIPELAYFTPVTSPVTNPIDGDVSDITELRL